MDAPDSYEMVSAAIHGVALIAALPWLALLIARGRGDQARVAALSLYGVGLVACFGASTLCHALVAAGHRSRAATAADHMAIYLLIAGTYTPIVVAMMPRHLRRVTLVVAWTAAVLGMALNAAIGPLPAWIATGFYLAMGWGGLWCYAKLLPSYSHRQIAALPLGGLLYSIGAGFHVARRPVLWPGVFGAHELFHVLVVLAAIVHFRFVWTYAAANPIAKIIPKPKLAGKVARTRSRV